MSSEIIRKDRMNQQDVASYVDVDQLTLSQREPDRMIPSDNALLKLSMLYGCTVDELIVAVLNRKGHSYD